MSIKTSEEARKLKEVSNLLTYGTKRQRLGGLVMGDDICLFTDTDGRSMTVDMVDGEYVKKEVYL